MNLGKFLKQYAVWMLLLLTLAITVYYWWQDTHSLAVVDGSDLLADKVQQSPRLLAKVSDSLHVTVDNNVSEGLYQRHLYVSQVDLFATPNAVEDNSPGTNASVSAPIVASTSVVQPAPVAPIPTAPPLPFTYVGKLIQDGKLAVFIGMRGQDMLIKKGEIIAQTYHIDDISSTEVKMTYLPLQIQQILKLESLN